CWHVRRETRQRILPICAAMHSRRTLRSQRELCGSQRGALRGISRPLNCLLLSHGLQFLKTGARYLAAICLDASASDLDGQPRPGSFRAAVVHVKSPAYLFNASLAVRKGANEIIYPPGTLWAERLDTAIPAVLAADLASLLPTDKIGASVGLSDDLATEIAVSIEQFDVSFSGQAVLVARWRILSAGGEKVLRS